MFDGKEGHTNIQISVEPGIKPRTLWLEGRDFTNCTNHKKITQMFKSTPGHCGWNVEILSTVPTKRKSHKDSNLGGAVDRTRDRVARRLEGRDFTNSTNHASSKRVLKGKNGNWDWLLFALAKWDSSHWD